jgi:glycosyltransferase involved in cell wall biosynthesis
VSKADSAGGGASRVAEQLAEALNELPEHQAVHINTWRSSRTPFTVPLYERFEGLYHRLRKLEKKSGWVDYFPFEYRRLRNLLRAFDADVIHFHDTSSAFSILTLNKLSKRYPTVWTFHDVSPVTGGCLYPGSCAKFESGCGGCPQLGEWPLDTSRDKTRHIAASKRRILRSGRIATVAPSAWMSKLAGPQFDGSPRVIYNGINTPKYQNLSQAEIDRRSKKLGLEKGLLTISWSCSDFSDPRKGAKIAVRTLNDLYDRVGKNFQLILLGNLSQKVLNQLPDVPLYIAGYVTDESAKAELLQLADVFLYSSLQDNQPLTVLESLCAGNEVVGTNTGGIPELSKKVSGALHLHKPSSANRIAENLEAFVINRPSFARKKAIQDVAEREFSMSTHVNHHIDLYQELVDAR